MEEENVENRQLKLMSAIKNLGALVSRANLATRLGSQYSGSRDMYQALGYPTDITYTDYAVQYSRQDIAKAVINRPAEATWRGDFTIIESDDDNETALEKAWKEMDKRLGLKSRFLRLDKLSSLGEYGVLFLGFDDGKAEGDLTREVSSAKKLLYVKPLGQNNATIQDWEKDTSSPRYGLPKIYRLTIIDSEGGTKDIKVHHSRVLHVTGELLESECLGVPALQSVYNRLKDLEKIVGGSAEMFWRGGRPGLHGKAAPDAQLTEDDAEDLMEQLDEYEHNLRRFLLTQNVEIESLATQVSDPTQAVDVQIQMISAVTGIPKRILTGSERGELASSQDRDNWFDYLKTRREEFAESQIVRPFVDKLIELGVLPPPKDEYSIKWEDLYAQSDKDKAEIGKARSEILKNYVSAMGAEDVMPIESFLEILMNLDQEQIELIMEQREQAIKEEEEAMRSIEEEMQRQQQDSLNLSPQGQQTPPNQDQSSSDLIRRTK